MPVTQFRSYSEAPRHGGGWRNQDLAEFYRIADIMAQAGLAVEADSGASDEDDPWFVFMRAQTGDVIAHFARIDGLFVAVSALTQEIFRGVDVRHVVDQMLKRHPLMIPQRPNGARLLLHPSVVLTAFVAAAFVIASDDAHAQTLDDVLQSTFGGKAAGLAGTQDGAADSDASTAPAVTSDTEVSVRKLAIVTSGASEAGRLTGNQLALISALIMACDLASRDLAISGDMRGDREVMIDGPLTVTLSAHPIPVVSNENSLTNGTSPDFDRTDEADIGDSVVTIAFAGQSTAKAGDEDTGSGVITLADAAFRGEQVVTINIIEPSRDDVVVLGVSQDVLMGGGGRDQLTLQHQAGAPVTTEQSATSNAGLSGGSSSVFVDLDGLVRALQNNADPSLNAFITDFGMSHDNYGVLLSQELEVLRGRDETTAKAVRLPSADLSFEGAGSLEDTDAPDNGAPTKIAPDISEKDTVTQNSAPAGSIPVKPLVTGHLLLQGEERSLVLTDAVDVLLYEGGDIEVHNFELGKDRLWFYLEAGEISAANYHLNTDGGLVMEFGSGDTLTLYEVLTQHDTAYTFT
jgi:hypothetical protein